jgi:hypothetical protein
VDALSHSYTLNVREVSRADLESAVLQISAVKCKNFENVGESCDCPPHCTTVEHTLMISSSTNARNLVGVNVFYESLILETRETSDSYSPWSLISDIGGNTGLFLGLTLLSGAKVLMLVVGIAKDCYYSHIKKDT